MKEIQVGEYVRTKGGVLFKTTEYWIAEYEKEPEVYTEIIKHSFNIIDLIEVRRLCKRRESYRYTRKFRNRRNTFRNANGLY